jgi:diguanylate cyclase
VIRFDRAAEHDRRVRLHLRWRARRLSKDLRTRVRASWRRTDRLTGLGARRLFEPTLRQLHRRGPVRLIVADVDGMRKILDTYGIPAGDAVLRQLGGIVAAEAPPGARAFRVGGDAVALVIPGERVAADSLAERIRERFEAAHVALDNPVEPLREFTLSAGVSSWGRRARVWSPRAAAQTQIAAAYRALGEAKGQGRNAVVGSTTATRAGTPRSRSLR